MGLRDRAEKQDKTGSAGTASPGTEAGSAPGQRRGLLARAQRVSAALAGAPARGGLRCRARSVLDALQQDEKKKQLPGEGSGGSLEQIQEQLDRTAFDLANLFELTKEINGTLDIDALLSIIIFTCMGQTGTQQVAVLTGSDTEGYSLRSSRGFEAAPDLFYLPGDTGTVPYLRGLEIPVTAGQLAADGSAVPEGWAQAAVELVVPLNNQEKLVGILLLGPRSNARSYSAEDCSFLSSLASLAAIALENARLYSSLEQKLNQLSALYNISRVINSAEEPEEVVNLAAETLSTGFQLQQLFLIGCNDDADQFQLLYQTGFPELFGARFPRNGEEPLLRFALDLQEPIEIASCADDENALSLLGEETAGTVKRLLLVPFLAGGRNVGVLGIGAVAGRPDAPFSQEEKELFSIIASQTAPPLLMAAMLQQQRSAVADPFSALRGMLEEGWAQAKAFDMPMTAVEICLDDFDPELDGNSLLQLLQQSGQRIRQQLDPRYRLVRTGLGRFTVCLPGMEPDGAAATVAPCLAAAEKVFSEDGEQCSVSCRCAAFPASYRDPLQYLMAQDSRQHG